MTLGSAGDGIFGKRAPFWGRLRLGLKALFAPATAEPGGGSSTLVVGHRGAPRSAPENTCHGVQLALDQGANGVELDVCVTRDGHPVLWHDRDPDHWTARLRRRGIEPGAYAPRVSRVARRPVAMLGVRDFLDHHSYVAAGDGASEGPAPSLAREVRPALLAEAMDQIARDQRAGVLMLDVKLATHEAGLARYLVAALARACNDYPSLRERRIQLLCSRRAVYHALAASLRAERTPHALYLSADFERPGVTEVARRLGASDVSIGIPSRLLWPSVREEVVEAVRARRRGEWSTVTVWTANRRQELRELFRAGVDAVVTDDVPLALEVAELARLPLAPLPHYRKARR